MHFMKITTVVCLSLAACVPAQADVFLRWNHAGFRPGEAKSLVAMSDTDLTGRAWRIERLAAGSGSVALATGHPEPVLRGEFAASVVGRGDHTPLAFNHVVDFSALSEPGVYRFTGPDGATAELQVDPAPYLRFVPEALRHLRVMRSGSNETILRQFSHPGDAHAAVWVPDGDVANGKWKPAEPAREVDALGGWYDAGDQIKFTLNVAYTTYHLLFAYRLDPAQFTRVNSRSDLPDVLDEARFGLEFLTRVFPDPDTFVIQVGDERDHHEPPRLPENDPLDGKRPALCALSRVHMGATAAALALGARTWRELGRADEAERYARLARAIFARALRPDAVTTAFERGRVNDFYLDPIDADQMTLAGAELFTLTGERSYLDTAIKLAPPAAELVSWGNWTWLANAALAASDPAAKAQLLAETDRYADRAATTGQPWSLPGHYTWASLHQWVAEANAAKIASLRVSPSAQRRELFGHMLDYTFGRNNWGVSFFFSEQLSNTVRQIYNPTYHILRAFPTGALSEGPGERGMHDALRSHFPAAGDDSLARFDTPAAVFVDSAGDFMCQETTVAGQSDIVLMLTLASLGTR